jgi:iron complex transport system substrate-binding protein
MRIVSLLPSATEIVYALGLGDQLVGVTHECDYPADARRKPALTRSILTDPSLGSAAIDAAIQDLLRAGHSPGSIYHIDAETLREVAPTLILTQQLCDVCAVSFAEVQRAVASVGGECRVLSLEPTGIDEIMDSIEEVGRLCGVEETARRVVADLRARLRAVAAAVEGAPRPRVLCVEWLDPPFTAGHWVPEQVRLAGGVEVLDRAGRHSERARWAGLLPLAPEVVVLLPCGFDLAGTIQEAHRTAPPPGWADLPAVRHERVYAVDGSAYFSRPGPRVVDGVELLAHILHPDRVPAPPPGRLARLEPGSHPWGG